MFVPTIKYKRVDTVKEQPSPVIKNTILEQTTFIKNVSEKTNTLTLSSKYTSNVEQQLQKLSLKKTNNIIVKEEEDKNNKEEEKDNKEEGKKDIKEEGKKDNKIEEKDNNKINENTVTFEETVQPTIIVDPKDNERILITLTDGTQYTTDRYCPHAGADLSYLGQVEEDEYPPEIGPIILCTLHYWEYALKKGGRGANGVATINACPIKNSDQCEIKKELDW